MKFRFVDQILSYQVHHFIVGTKAVSLEEYFLSRPLGFKDYFPPTLMIESLFQLGNFLIFKSFQNKLAYITMFNRIDIQRPLTKGEVMQMRVELTGHIEDTVKLNGRCHVDDETVLKGSGCIAKLVNVEQLVNPDKYTILFESLYSNRG